MKAVFRILGTAAAVAVGAAAVALVNKALEKERSTFAQLAHETAEPAEPLSKAPEAVQQAAAALTGDAAVEEVAEEAVEEPAVADPGAVRGEEPAAQQPDAPNPNPVEAAPAVAPRTADGKIDVAKLVDPADFADWDEWGCKS